MGRRKTGRLALAIACASLAGACVVNLSFDMDQRGVALLTAGAGAVSASAPVDLTKQPDIEAHRADIRSLDLDSLDVTITAVNLGNQAKQLNLTLSLRKSLTDPPENDVAVGDVAAFPVIPNATRHIPGNPKLDAFLLERLNGDGQFHLIVNGTTDGKTDVIVDINLHASMAYDTGFF